MQFHHKDTRQMLFSYNWLKEYIDGLPPAHELGDLLTMSGTEVETITEPGREISGVVTAQVLSCEPHPNADRLQLCRVNSGGEELSIVCGARNMKPGDKVALALVGAVLPGDFKIKKSKIRGVESFGMMCSEVELGLAEESAGIMILPEDTPLGVDVRGPLGLNDAMMEVGITPNRPDQLSVRGLAREISAVTGLPLKARPAQVAEGTTPVDSLASVFVEEGSACKRYTARVVENVKVAPSPDWLAQRLEGHGIRPINNVVDVTNYVLLQLGQPMHAFDLSKLEGREVTARNAAPGEEIVTIDGKRRELDEEMLVIADAKGPVALAGVMGGKDTEVSGSTTTVLLESAWFAPSSVRRTSRKTVLSSESSYRFERGVDMEALPEALDVAAAMIKELAGGEIAAGVIDVYPEELTTSQIKLRVGRTSAMLGVTIDAAGAADMLVRLGMAVEEAGEGALLVTPPSYRVDITGEIDLVEEVARMYGYSNIPTTMPVARITPGSPGIRTRLRRKVSSTLASEGFSEVMNYSFVSREMFAMTGEGGRDGVTIMNPLSEDQVVMRDSIVPSLLDTLRRNIFRKNEDVRIFEFAPVFKPVEGEKLPDERWTLSALMHGRRWGMDGRSWSYTKEQLDFFDMKGVVEKLFDVLGFSGDLQAAPFEGGACATYHPGRSASVSIGGKSAGFFGQLHPELAARFDVKTPVFAFELCADSLAGLYGRERVDTPLPRFPESTRDVAFIVDESVPYAEIINSIKLLNAKLIEKVELFDVYYGGNIPGGNRSVALRIVYRSSDRTLTHEEVDEAHDGVCSMLEKKFDVEIRGRQARGM